MNSLASYKSSVIESFRLCCSTFTTLNRRLEHRVKQVCHCLRRCATMFPNLTPPCSVICALLLDLQLNLSCFAGQEFGRKQPLISCCRTASAQVRWLPATSYLCLRPTLALQYKRSLSFKVWMGRVRHPRALFQTSENIF